jgi:hypothetical protein
MKVYLVSVHHEYEGIQDILAVYSERRMAEEFIEEYNKNDSTKAARSEELRKMSDVHYFGELAKMGILAGTKECMEYPWEKAEEIEEAFRSTLSEEDRETMSYFAKSAMETLIVMERELQ